MAKNNRPRPVVLMILDGYGLNPLDEGNAVRQAKQPNMTRYFQEYPLAAIRAAGIEVGLPWGEMGNSETGHQNMGSGKLLYQPLHRISIAIEDGSFFQNKVLVAAAKKVKANPQANFHIMGVLSDGGVHGHIDHIIALVRLAVEAGIGERTYIHAFLDGRDSPPDAAGSYGNQLDEAMKKLGGGTLASMVGRYFAMDRNQNWDRTQVVYDLLVHGKGQPFTDWREALHAVYDKTDLKSFEVAPAIVLTQHEAPIATVKEGDAVIFANYRPDRASQLASAFALPKFKNFPITKWKDLMFVTMTSYGDDIPTTVAFAPQKVEQPLGRVLSDAGLKQLRIAESEKYAHVTYFFDGGQEQVFAGEDRKVVPSKNVRDYSEVPAMSAKEISDEVVAAISKNTYDVIVINYANPDMVAHTGKFEPTVKALEFLDTQIGRVVDAVVAAGGAVLVTADHGHAESVVNLLTHKASTDHTSNPVPLLYITSDNRRATPRPQEEIDVMLTAPIGVLADVAPTVLEIVGVAQPTAMTARSLLSSLL